MKTILKTANKVNRGTVKAEAIQAKAVVREEAVQAVAVVSTPPTAVTVTTELTEEQEEENKQIVLADLDLFG